MPIKSSPEGTPDNRADAVSINNLQSPGLAPYWLSAIIDSADDAIITNTLDGVITSWNKGAERTFGYTAEEAVGRPATILIPADHHDEEPAILARLRAGERIEHYETVRVRKDGTPVDISLIVSPIRSPDGRVIGASKIARDISARRRVEEALRESEEKYRSLLENANDIIYSHDLEGNYLTINRACEEITGYTREEILGGLNIAQVVAPDHLGLAREMTRLKLRDPSPTVYEIDIMTRDGRRLTLEVSTRVAQRGGRGAVVEGIARDVTERKRAEEELQKSNRRLEELLSREQKARAEAERQRDFTRLVLEDAPIAVGVMEGPDHRFALVNRVTCEITGLPEDQFLGRPHAEVVPDADEVVGPILDRVYATGASETDEIEVDLLTGRRHLLVTWTALPGRDGQPGSVLYLSLDITDRKRMEGRLRESETQLRTLADAVPQLVWMAEPDGHIFWYNQRWYEYTGTTPEQMEGWGWQSVHDPEMLERVVKRWKASLETGEPFEMEFPLKGADGSFRWFLTRVNPIRDFQGRLVRWFGTNTDVDEQRRIAREREQLLASEQQARAQAEVNLNLHRSVEERLGLLVEASGVLLGSLSLEAVQPAILDLSRRMISADAYAIWRLDTQTDTWRIVSAAGMSETYYEQMIRGAEQAPRMPAEPIIAEDVSLMPILATRRELYEAEGIKSLLVVPLRIHGINSGTLTFYYRRAYKFSETEVRVASALANLSGSAISAAELYEEQSRVRAAAEEAERRSKFLAEASTLLASSLDYQTTLAQVARLAVPELADWCAVDMRGTEGQSCGSRWLTRTPPKWNGLTNWRAAIRLTRTPLTESL
jgi:PAS domain S-box-containing protein